MSACLPDQASLAPTSGRFSANIALLASALVLCGLIIVQLGRGGQRPSAPDAAMAAPLTLAMAGMNADVVSRVGDYSMLSFNAGSDDVLVIMDGRGEQIFAYRIQNQREVQFLERASLPEIFQRGKVIGAGRK